MMAGKVAFLFPGQGVLPEGPPPENDVSELLLGLASQAHIPLKKWLQQQREDHLSQTEYAQLAIFIDSVSKCSSLRAMGIVPSAVAGHSLGEYAALVASGVLELEEAFHVVKARGCLMGKASNGGMVAILKLTHEEVERVCKETRGNVVVANINAPTQIVVSGEKDALEEVMSKCDVLGGRSIRLDVSGPFHSPLLSSAQDDLSSKLEGLDFCSPRLAFVSSVSGRKEDNPEHIKALLLTQITACVKWVNTIESLLHMGIDVAVDVGPGQVLTNLGRRITDKIKFVTFEGAIDGAI